MGNICHKEIENMHSYVIFKNVQSCRIKSAVPVLDKGTYERQKY